jgi:1-aminocyclopropane-1-carboxylate deaminase/D-cysteine desulfhydrase-like pyridoxal-dependent ACC family enzyme
MLPRKEIAHLPTPIENLPSISSFLNGPELLIKRDDQTGLALAQSNHCRQTAAAAARCGLDCTLVLVGPEPSEPSGNYFLDQLLGAKIVWTEKSARDRTLNKEFQKAQESGAKPYLIPYGGSNALGAYAYYQAFQELSDQFRGDMPDWIVFASSSGGTQAGLHLASLVFGGSNVLGISVDEPENQLRESVASISRSLVEVLGLNREIDADQILVNATYTGEGYGIINDQDREAIRLFAEKEGILMDPVYTGRAAGGMIDLIRNGFFDNKHKVLFWHTGGIPALFAQRYIRKI